MTIQDYARVGSVKYRPCESVKPQALLLGSLLAIIDDKRRAKGTAEDATDLSAEYRGYKIAHIGVFATQINIYKECCL